MSMLVNIVYLEDDDFNEDNSLKPHVNGGKPLVLMVQGSFCGFCTKAKPAFKEFAKGSSEVVAATLQIDGGPSEKAAAKRISKWHPQYRGVPCYIGFGSDGRVQSVHEGGRDVDSLKKFCHSLK